MKKRILLVLTLLVAFFGFMGLSVRNQQVEVYAAGNQDSTDYDLQVVLNNIPSRAILSFPVTYESVYGNTISFEVEENQTVIIEDEEAHWMVVNRPTDADAEIDITVTVVGENGAKSTGTKPVSVPKGTTTTKEFTISYELNGGTNNENNKGSYKLGQKTIELNNPTKEGYLFAGWYENSDFSGNQVRKILVGSMKNYTLYAKWTKMAFSEENVSFVEIPAFTYDGTEKMPAVQVSNPYGEGYLELGEDKDFKVEYANNIDATTNELKANAIITGVGEYAGSEVVLEFEIAKANLTIIIEDASKTYGDDDPELKYEAPGLANKDKEADLKISRQSGNNVGSYEINSSYVNSNYNISVEKGTFKINPKTLTLTPKASKQYNLGITPTWSISDFNFSEFAYEENESVLEGSITATYYKDSVENNLTEKGEYQVVFSGLSSDNYEIVIVNGEVEVVVADVNFIAKDYTYNGDEQTLEVTIEDKEGNPIENGTVSYTNNKYTNAGTYSISVRFEHSEYGIVETNVDVTIDPSKVTITATSQTKEYGAEDPDLRSYFTATGLFVDNETLESWISREEGQTVRDYVVTLDITELESNENYDIISAVKSTTLTINKKDLTIVAHSQTRIYGETKPAKSVYFTSDDLVLGDTIKDEWVTGDESNGFGTYTIELDTSTLSANYNILGTTSTTLTINKKDLTIIAHPRIITYGDEQPDKSVYFTSNDLVLDDIINVSWVTGDKSNAGTHTVTLNTSELSVNYNVLGATSTTLTVNQKSLTITISSIEKTYGDDDPDYVFETTGLLDGEELDILGFTRVTGEDVKVGGYAISYNVEKMPNYSITYNEDAVLTINPFDLSDEVVDITLSTYDNNLADAASLQPEITVMYGDTNVTSFTSEYPENHIVGDNTITITFIGNYKGSVTHTMVVTSLPRALEDAKVIGEVMSELETITDGYALPTAQYGSDVYWFAQTTGVTVVDGIVVINENLFDGSNVVLYANISFEDGAQVVSYELSVLSFVEITDESGIIVEDVPSNLDMIVEEVDAETADTYVEAGEEVLAAYDIEFKKGEDKVSNPGTVTVKIPLDGSYDKSNLTVYHRVDGENIEVPFDLVDGYVVFKASSFSPYMIVTTKTYTVKWIDGNGDIIKTETVRHGETPNEPTETPIKDATAEYTYEFTGWSPTIGAITEDATYTAQFSQTPIAVEEVWQLVTDASELKAGDKIVIVAAEYDYALSTTQNTNNRGQITVNKSGSTITIGADVQIITLDEGQLTSTFALNVGDGYLYAAGGTGSNNYLKTNSKDSIANVLVLSWNITIDSNGNATIISADTSVKRNTMRYNNQSGLFACYASGQQNVSIYKLTADSSNNGSDTPVESTKYSVSVAYDSNQGTATLSSTEVSAGESVTLTVTPNENYKVSNITVNGNNIYEEGQFEYTLEITNITTIIVTYELDEIKDNEGDGNQSQQITASVDISKQGYTNQQAITEINVDQHVDINFDKRTNSNAPKYYNTGTAIRVYGGSTFTIISDYNITSIIVTYSSPHDKGEANIPTVNVGTYSESNLTGTWSGSSKEVVFTVGSSSGHVRILSIEVTYETTVSN